MANFLATTSVQAVIWFVVALFFYGIYRKQINKRDRIDNLRKMGKKYNERWDD